MCMEQQAAHVWEGGSVFPWCVVHGCMQSEIGRWFDRALPSLGAKERRIVGFCMGFDMRYEQIQKLLRDALSLVIFIFCFSVPFPDAMPSSLCSPPAFTYDTSTQLTCHP